MIVDFEKVGFSRPTAISSIVFYVFESKDAAKLSSVSAAGNLQAGPESSFKTLFTFGGFGIHK